MEHRELVELNETAAYESLVAEAETTGQMDFRSERISGGCALLAPALARMVLLNRVIDLGVGEPATEDQVADLAELYAGTNPYERSKSAPRPTEGLGGLAKALMASLEESP